MPLLTVVLSSHTRITNEMVKPYRKRFNTKPERINIIGIINRNYIFGGGKQG